MEYKDFQKAAIRKVVDGYESNRKNNRFLVADEVGLGKTIIAKGAIRCLCYFEYLKYLKTVAKKPTEYYEYNILYLCSNLNIAEQNKSKLGVSSAQRVSLMDEVILGGGKFEDYKGNRVESGSSVENRTTMLLKKMLIEDVQSITAEDLRDECIKIYGEDDILAKEESCGLSDIMNKPKIKLNIIPITTKTSIEIKGKGHQDERSFIVETIKKLRGEMRIETEEKSILVEFEEQLKRITEKYPKFKRLVDFEDEKENWQLLRQLFALASIELLKYDFVIMDEFQNFSDILNKANATQYKKINYYDKAKYIVSVFDKCAPVTYAGLSKNIKENFKIESAYELTEIDRNFWAEKLKNGKIDENADIEMLILKFEEMAKKRLSYSSIEAQNFVDADATKEKMLQLVKCIISREDKREFVSFYYHNISGEFFDNVKAETIVLKDGSELCTRDIYCKKEKSNLLNWWEQERLINFYQELRDDGNIKWESIPMKKVPFRYLLNIHFAEKDEDTDIANTILNCFMRFIENKDEKVYLWQYAYLLTNILAADTNRLNYSVEQLEPMRVLLGTYIFKNADDGVDFDEKCENIVIEKIFNNEFQNDKYTKILMLSATPFRMYIDKDSREAEDVNIINVCDFLDTNAQKGLGNSLTDYKNELLDFSHNQNKELEDVLEKKKSFQENMNRVFTRMERYAVLRELNENWFESQANAEKDDELKCGRIKDLFCYLKQATDISEQGSVISYVQDAPYMGTFMHAATSDKNDDGYKWKKAFNNKVSNADIPYSEDSYVYLSNECFNRKEKALGQWHGVYENALYKILDLDELTEKAEPEEEATYIRNNHPGAARLLWVPSCVNKDKLKGAFAEHKDYGKTIVFSRLVQVPRMIAGLTSYETLRRLVWMIEDNLEVNKQDEGIFSKLLELLNSSENVDSLSTYQKLDKILGKTHTKIKECLLQDEDIGIKNICREAIRKYCKKYLDSDSLIDKIDGKCIQLADAFAEKLINNVLLNRHQGMFAIWATEGFYAPQGGTEITIEAFVKDCADKVLKYCEDGCLSDVLDEWLYICLDSEQDIGQFLGIYADKTLDCLSFIKSTSLTVSLYENDNGKVREVKLERKDKADSVKIDTYFARCIGMSQDDDKINTIKGLQQSFNAPFAPFVFATTSMGQEGLDFHYYADKIIHWRLPANPVDFEQREGRINRYHCLALRKKLIEWYGENANGDAYVQFLKALQNAREILLPDEKDASNSSDNRIVNCGLIPDWILMNPDKSECVSIKRYVPYFYLSRTNEDFHKNLKVLQLYRSVIGQTDPGEVMDRLMNDKNVEDVKQLFVDFSPYNVLNK